MRKIEREKERAWNRKKNLKKKRSKDVEELI